MYANTTDNQAEVHIKPAQQSKTSTVTIYQRSLKYTYNKKLLHIVFGKWTCVHACTHVCTHTHTHTWMSYMINLYDHLIMVMEK